MRKFLIALAMLLALASHQAAAHSVPGAIPEPPPYFWEYLPDHAVAFLPVITLQSQLPGTIPPAQQTP